MSTLSRLNRLQQLEDLSLRTERFSVNVRALDDSDLLSYAQFCNVMHNEGFDIAKPRLVGKLTVVNQEEQAGQLAKLEDITTWHGSTHFHVQYLTGNKAGQKGTVALGEIARNPTFSDVMQSVKRS